MLVPDLVPRQRRAIRGPQPLLGEIVVLEVLDVLDDRLTRIKALRPAGLAGQFVEASFDLFPIRCKTSKKGWHLQAVTGETPVPRGCQESVGYAYRRIENRGLAPHG